MIHDIILTLPCPLCGYMLTGTWEPLERSAGADLPPLVYVRGCEHAELWESERGWRCRQDVMRFYNALHHEIHQYCLDLYTDQLEQSAKWRRRDG